MDHNSRTYKSLLNSGAAFAIYAVNFLLSFLSRRVFLNRLGSEILGLNSTTGSLLAFLNLAELGIGVAVGFTLYKPLQKKDIKTVGEVVSLQGWFYKKVAWLIILGSFLLLCFFPRIFEKSELPIWYPIISYCVLLFSSLLGYFVNYKQIVLSASQQQYRVQYSVGGLTIAKVILQLLAVYYLPMPYFWWAGLEVISTVVCSIALNNQIKKAFPDLKTDTSAGRELQKKYPTIIAKVKQLFVHKIATVALNQTSPIIIYAFASLTMVTNYGNYLAITHGISHILNVMFNSMNAGVGNLIAEGNRDRIFSVFRELFSSRFLILSSICFCIFHLSASFITLWLGHEYVLDTKTVLLIVLLFYIYTSREVIDAYLNGYGLFQDVWAPIVEAVLNVGCSILFGYFGGLTGILAGVLMSQLVIIFTWKPIFLFKYGLQRPVLNYILMYLKHIGLFSISAVAVYFIMDSVPVNPSSSFLSFIFYGGIMELSMLLILGVLLFFCEEGMRHFVNRMAGVVGLNR